MSTQKRVVMAGEFGPIDYLAEAHRLRAEAFSQFLAQAVVGIGAQIERVTRSLRAAWRRRVTVEELRALDDRLLADIGLSRHEVLAMAAGHRPAARLTEAAMATPAAEIVALIQKTVPSSPAPDHADDDHRRAA